MQQYIVEHTHTHIHKLCRRESKRTKTLKGYEDCVKRKKKKSEKENKKVEAKELKSDNKKDNKNAKGWDWRMKAYNKIVCILVAPPRFYVMSFGLHTTVLGHKCKARDFSLKVRIPHCRPYLLAYFSLIFPISVAHTLSPAHLPPFPPLCFFFCCSKQHFNPLCFRWSGQNHGASYLAWWHPTKNRILIMLTFFFCSTFYYLFFFPGK